MWPDLPKGAKKLGLTDSLWEVVLRCLGDDIPQQPSMTEVIGLLRELLMPPLSVEADLCDFLEVCKSRGRDGQGEKARKFADKLDEVRHTESHNVNFPHHRSRHLTTRIFPKKNGSNI